MNQTRNPDEFQGRRSLEGWEKTAPHTLRLDKITEALAGMRVEGGEFEVGNANYGASSGPASASSSPPPENHEWAEGSRDSINAMLSTMSNSRRGPVVSDYGWSDDGEIPPRRNKALVFAGVLTGILTIGIAGYGFYLLGQKEAVFVAPEVMVAKKAPEITSEKAPISARADEGSVRTNPAMDKDLSRIADGENAHLTPNVEMKTDAATVLADSASSLKTTREPQVSVGVVLSDSVQADRSSAKPAEAPVVETLSPPIVKAAPKDTPVIIEVVPVKPKEALAPVEASPAVPKETPVIIEVVPAKPKEALAPVEASPAVPKETPVIIEVVPAKPKEALAPVEASPAVPKETPAIIKVVPAKPKEAAAEAEVALVVPEETPALTKEGPVVQDEKITSLDSLTKSVVLAIVALGSRSDGAISGKDPADVLRTAMSRLVAAAAGQGKPVSDVELMLENALTGLPEETIPDLLKDARGKVNVKMLLSAVTPRAEASR